MENENIFISGKLLPSFFMAMTLVHCPLVSLQAFGLLYMSCPLSTIVTDKILCAPYCSKIVTDLVV